MSVRKFCKLSYCYQLVRLLLFTSFACFGASQLYAQTAREETPLQVSLVKAYLYITSRTTWPEGAIEDDSFVFCINRNHELFETFSTFLPTKQIHKKKIELRFFNESSASDQLKCNLIALSKNEKGNKMVAANVKNSPILTIGHETDVTLSGGVVFLAHDKKLEPPKINFSVLKSSGLKIDSGILDISQRRWGKEE